MTKLTPLERFEAKYEPEPITGCWLWTARLNNKGYGMFTNHGDMLAHRASYEFYIGLIPEGLCVLHRCDTPPCVNPSHLFLGTKGDNNRDTSAKGRHWNQRKRVCSNGHEFTEDNTYWKPSGGRACRRCVAAATREWYIKTGRRGYQWRASASIS